MGLIGECAVDLTHHPAGKNEVLLPRLGSSATAVRRADADIVDTRSSVFDMDRILRNLKSRGLLPADNRTNALKDFFVSATGELVLNARNNRMTIETDRFQGLCAEAGSRADLRNFRVKSMNRRGCLALASIDGTRSIRDARRLLLFVVTNALNSGMVFEEEDQRVCLDHGSTPILIESGTFEMEILTDRAEKMTLYALAPDGTRLEKIPVRKMGKGIAFTLRTADLKRGPSLYFELAQ